MPPDEPPAPPTPLPAMPAGADLVDRLAAATPAERTALFLELLGQQPGPVDLSAPDGTRYLLDGIDLGRESLRPSAGEPPPWWDTARDGVRLRKARLRGVSLRHANLNGVLFEEADLRDTDLAEANLAGANLSGADLRGALLEDADLQKAVLRFAHGAGSVWEEARLAGADLWGADLVGADFSGADLQGAVLEEAKLQGADLQGVNLRGANLKRANLAAADLRGADLRDAAVGGTNLAGALLRDARLQDLDLTGCTLTHIHASAAHLDKTRLDQEQLGGALGEEVTREYGAARKGYLALERNFEDLGDHDAARWAYARRRRMEKREAFDKARTSLSTGRWLRATRHAAKAAGDQLVEWVCDYGESVWRVLGTLLVVFLLFIPIYGAMGAIVRVEREPVERRTVTHDVVDLALFSMTAMTSPGNPPDYLLPRNEVAYMVCGVQTLLSIFLTGLMGFVAGNRIRR